MKPARYRKLLSEQERIWGVIRKKEEKLEDTSLDTNGRNRIDKEIKKQQAKLAEIDKELEGTEVVTRAEPEDIGEMAESG